MNDLTSQEIVLEAEDVGKQFGDVVALKGVNLEIRANATVALIGESGSGKSTLLRCFNRLVSPDSGRICLRGTPLERLDPVSLRRGVGYVPQDGGLLPHWTIERNIGLVPKLKGWTRAARQSKVNEMLELVGLSGETYRRRYPRELSGGERQRVAFARALAAEPEVILLDEPFGSLDALTRFELRNEFQRIQRERAFTTLLVTHDINEALQLGTTIAVMKNGILLQHGRPKTLLSNPSTNYVTDLLAMREGESRS
jgi:osmoprotectant transport system ATP-binding protein